MAHLDQSCRLQSCSSQSVAMRYDGWARGLSSAQTIAPSIAHWYSAVIALDDDDGHQPEQQHNARQETHMQVATGLMRMALRLVGGVQKTRRRQRRQPAHYCYMDAYSWTIVDCTWACAQQAIVRVRYFLKGDDGAVDPRKGGWRPVHRRGSDAGMALECRPKRRGSGSVQLGLSPSSFKAMCACACCGTPVFVPRARVRSSAASCMAARDRQGDDALPYRLRCLACVDKPVGWPARNSRG